MPGILETAFRSTCSVKRQVSGGGNPDQVILNGIAYEDALVSVMTESEAFVAGGKAESGGFRVQVLQADVFLPIMKFDSITVRGQNLKVLSVNDVNGVAFEIAAGDPAIET